LRRHGRRFSPLAEDARIATTRTTEEPIMGGSLILTACLCATPLQEDEVVDAAQFHRLLLSAMESIRDVSFVFEGDVRRVGPAKKTTSDAAEIEELFQGIVDYRFPDDFYLSIFKKHENSLLKNTLAVKEGRLSILEDRDPKRLLILPSRGGINGFTELGTPLSYFQSPHLALSKSPESLGYKFEGWEDIHGHRCLIASLDVRPGVPSHRKRYWFDVNRGMHSLKTESYHMNQMIGNTVDVELAKIVARDGAPAWFPVRATTNLMTWNGAFLDKPAMIVTHHVLESSLVINQGLDDSRFDLKTRAGEGRPRGISPDWIALMEDNKKPKRRTDAKSVKADLDRALAEADRQARFLDASAAAVEETWWSRNTTAATIVVAALALALVGLGWFRGRGR
jgi:hypothetical protein